MYMYKHIFIYLFISYVSHIYGDCMSQIPLEIHVVDICFLYICTVDSVPLEKSGLYSLHFTDKTKAHRGQLTQLQSHSL